MRWAKTSLRNSFFGWMAHSPAAEPGDRLEEIRKAMLLALEQTLEAKNTAIERKLLFAQDLDELWYARPDLMTVIAADRGESVARDCLAEITPLFKGKAPGVLRRSKRPAPPKA